MYFLLHLVCTIHNLEIYKFHFFKGDIGVMGKIPLYLSQ